MMWFLTIATIVAGTFASEDLTCISDGLLIREGKVTAATGVLGCFWGIFLGDLGLWALGRVCGRAVRRVRWLRARLPESRLHACGDWFDRQGWRAIVATRFLPGTRLPLYVAAGMLGRKSLRFIVWSFLAALVWTPLLVLSVAAFGGFVVVPAMAALGNAPWVIVVSAVSVYGLWRVAARMVTPLGRSKVMATVSRLWRWEFWPTWLFYLPVVPWIAWLALRYRSLTVWTLANPGIPDGGVVGESKQAILEQLPPRWTLPSELIRPGDQVARVAHAIEAMRIHGWEFPVILKPDAGQRGQGVRLAKNREDVGTYFAEHAGPTLVQQYHPGPYEAGIFYIRIPGESHGRIFSLTDKRFPILRGDGVSTLEALVWRHSRYRMQAAKFLARHAAVRQRVLADGETFVLAMSGNHSQGTMFCDGKDLITPELEQAIDAIAQQFYGFYVGRFDVRYSDAGAFRAGRELAIVELNGVTSEPGDIYDPARSLFSAYRELYQLWRILFAVGNAHRAAGIEPTSTWELLGSVRGFYSQFAVNPVAS
jgi:membrane protein DedA with SNARE-associated domain